MMPLYTDQIGRKIEITPFPKRIISLVPSQTELLFHLGLEEEVTGITKFCVHPEKWFREKTRVGGTKQLEIDKIKTLRPDLIIANKEENVQHQVEELAREFPVWISDVNSLAAALDMIESIGLITGKDKEAAAITANIRQGFERLTSGFPPLRCAYLIWKDPYMSAGGHCFINDMLKRCGFTNVFEHLDRYPEVTREDLQNSGCQILMLSSEPYPFKQKHAEELQLLLPSARIILVDGEMFSWYGSRLQLAPAYFTELQKQVLSLVYGAGAE